MDAFKHYDQAIAYLRGLAAFGIKPGLERMEALLALLGNPEKRAKFIHIGGTNGKGSTLAVMEAVFERLGWRTGRYISPHMHDWRERICWEGKIISEEDVLRGVNIICPLARAVEAQGLEHPTEFEVSTALAFWYFAEKFFVEEKRFDAHNGIVLLEVGMGGAIDSTNVIDPEVVVMTSISLDHMDYLGGTLTQIAGVKAGIIKGGKPVVASFQLDEVWQVLAAVCRGRGAPLICAGLAEGAGQPTGGSEWVEAEVELPGETGPPGVESWPSADGWAYAVPLPALSPEGAEHSVRFDYYGLDANLSGCEVTLAGRHQVLNAATALAAVEVFLQRERGSVSQWSGINLMALSSCQLSIDVKWPGRLELIRCTYLDKTVRVLLDGAHNEDGVRVLREALVQGYPRRRLVICFAMLADKAVEASLGVLMPLGDAFVMTRPPSSRAGDWKKLASMVRGAGYLCVEEENIESAMRRAMSLCGEEDLLCVTGSLYMLAQARSYALSCVV